MSVMNTTPPQTETGTKALAILARYAGVALILLILIWGVSRLLVRPVSDLLGRASDAFGRVFSLAPQTTIKGDTVVIEKSSIAELAVVARKTETVIVWKNTAVRSTKTLIVRGDFVAKAGFDLNQAFQMQIDKKSGDVTVDFPKAKVLSVEMKHHEIIFSDDGVINWLNAQDHEQAMKAMEAKAREDAEKSDLTEEVIQQVNTRVRDLLHGAAHKITVRYNDTELPDVRRVQ